MLDAITDDRPAGDAVADKTASALLAARNAAHRLNALLLGFHGEGVAFSFGFGEEMLETVSPWYALPSRCHQLCDGHPFIYATPVQALHEHLRRSPAAVNGDRDAAAEEAFAGALGSERAFFRLDSRHAVRVGPGHLRCFRHKNVFRLRCDIGEVRRVPYDLMYV